jgi:uncharacterized protein involved in exopolysaccharide biosynthesis/Mrp family chromosome partitioning ATPase
MFTVASGQAEQVLRAQGSSHAAPSDPRQIASTNDAFTPAAILRSVTNRKSWLITGALTGTLAALLLSLTIPNQYRATAQLLIDPRDLRVLRDEVSPAGFNSDAATSFVESQARVISSDSIKRLIIASEGLDQDPEFGAPEKGGSILARFNRDVLGMKASKIDPVIGSLLALDKKVTVRRGERTFVIDINVMSEDAEKAARIANALAATYIEDQGNVRADSARKATVALTSRLDELRQSVKLAEEKAQKFKARNNIVDAAGKVVSEEQLQQSVAQLVSASSRTSEAKARFDQSRLVRISSIEAGAIPEAVSSNTITALRAQLGAALAREADLIANLGPQHPGLLAAQSQVRDARRQISDELGRIMQAAKAEYERARSAEQALSGRVDALKRDTLLTSAALVPLREIEREVEASRAVYQAFLLRARETGEQVSVNVTNARIISEATPPVFRSNIGRKVILLGGLIAGLGLGAAAAILRGLLSGPGTSAGFAGQGPGSKRAPAFSPLVGGEAQAPSARVMPFTVREQNGGREATAHAAHKGSQGRPAWRTANGAPKPPVAPTSLAQLAQILGVETLSPLAKGGDRKWRLRSEEACSVFQGQGFITDSLDKKTSDYAKAVSQILASAVSHPDADENHKILVLGLKPRSGASTLALNLALAAGQEGATPLLIDGAAGVGTLSDKLAPEVETGLADVVTGKVGLIRATLQDDHTGVFFLPGAAHEDATLAGKIATGLFPFVRRFNPVIIDGGAIRHDETIAALAKGADIILLIGKEQDVTTLDMSLLTTSLGSAASKLHGIIQNNG